MNKLAKIFFSIIILLAIVLVIMTCLYFNMRGNAYKFRDAYVEAANELVKITQAIETAGSKLQMREDGTLQLVEQID